MNRRKALNPNWLRRNLLPTIFVCVHTAFIALIWAVITLAPGPNEAREIWWLPYLLDFPVSIFLPENLPDHDDMICALAFAVGGGIWWGFIGFVIQTFNDKWRADKGC